MRCVTNKILFKGLFVLLGLLITSVFNVHAEGILQLAPTAADAPIMLESGRPDFANFAAYDGPENGRLYISINNPNEVVFLGLSVEYSDRGLPYTSNPTSAQYRYRIKKVVEGTDDPIVHGPFLITTNNANLDVWGDALFGNYDVTTTDGDGNLMYEFNPDEAGDYYIEFDDVAISDSNDNLPDYRKVNIGLWDITVTDNGTPIDGRVWSKNWALRTPEVTGDIPPDCEWDRQFKGAFYSYTTDGFVSKIDFADAGMQGLTFLVAFNSKGPGTSGDLSLDRMSVPDVNATANASEHKIFLSPPDPNIFLSGICGTITPASSFQCNGDNTYCIEIAVSKPGQVELIIDFNQNGILDPSSQDVSIVYEFLDGTLSACVPWDGLRGDGSPIGLTDTVDLIFNYAQGIQHWSAYDVEFMRNGYCIETIRPICSGLNTSNQLFWDDRNILEDPGTGALKDGRNGCDCETGCRSWDNFNINSANCNNVADANTTGYGDKTTLNTWWFATSITATRASIPLVNITITGPEDVCNQETVTYTAMDQGATGDVTYQWSGPDNFMATTGSIEIGIAGEYCVTITDELNCTSNTCKTLIVIPTAVDDINYPENLSACTNTIIPISPTGDITGHSFLWAPVSGGITDATLPSQNINIDGDITYTVEITDDLTGCSFIKTINLAAFTDPIPAFTTQTGCEQGYEVNFVNQSTNAVSYMWDFGVDGIDTDVSADGSPSYIYPAPGDYLIQLTATSADGCQSTISQTITVVDIPLAASFEVNYGDCDANSVTVQFTNTSINGANNTAQYSWNFNVPPNTSMLENPSIVLTSSQSVTAELTIVTLEGCIDNISQTFDVELGAPDDQFPADLLVCPGESVQIVPGGDPSYTYNWSPVEGIDDPTSAQPTFSPTATTTYTVTITSSAVDDCTVIENVEVTVPEDINLEVMGGGVFCTASTTLTATTNVDALIIWQNSNGDSIGNGNSLTVDISGDNEYTIVATDELGCSDVISNLSVNGGPIDFTTPDTVAVCLGEEVTLNVTNLDANDILSYNWTPAELFVPGTETNAVPDFIEAIGTYEVTVELTNQYGCQAQADIHVAVVDPTIELGFTSVTDCAGGRTVSFTNTSTNAFGYVWNFGDGSDPSFEENPEHTYENEGVYIVTLGIVYDVSCINGPFTDDVIVEIPLVNFSAPDTVAVCFGEEVILDITNLDLNDVLTYNWAPAELFVPGTETNPIPDFIESIGTHEVTVDLMNQHGCEAQANIHIAVVDPTIELGFTSVTDCAGGRTVSFTNTSINAFGYVWNFGDGSDPSFEENPQHTYENEGTYTVTLDIVYDVNCLDEPFSDDIIVEIPLVNFSAPDTVAVCLGEEVILDITNLDLNDVLTYNWTPAELFVPGTETNAIPDFIESIGTHEVSVGLMNQHGCEAQADIHIAIIDPTIELGFTSIIDCSGGTVSFTNTSTNAFGYVWNFGDGSDPSFEESPQHMYEDGGTYTVTLDIIYDVSCVAEPFSEIITVEAPQIIADFTYGITECSADSATIQFFDNSTNSLNNTIGWAWTFSHGDPLSSSAQDTSITVYNSGPLEVSFTILTGNDCNNTYTETLDIQLVSIDISLTDTIVVCPGTSTVLNPAGDMDLVYNWTPAEELDDPTATSPIVTPTVTTTYYTTAYSLVGSDTCFVTDSVVVFVPDDINLVLDQEPVVVTCGEDVTITATADVEVDIVWSSTLEGTLPETSNSITVNPFQTDTIIATVTDQYGCIATDSIIINDIGVDITIDPSTSLVICDDVEAVVSVFNLDPEDMLTYEWSPVEYIVGPTNLDSAVIRINELGEFIITSIVNNQHGCADTVDITVTVEEFAGLQLDTIIVCANEPTPINPGGDPLLTHNWSPVDEYLDLTDPSNPVVTTNIPLTYYVTITDNVFGCTAMDSIFIDISPEMNLDISPQSTTLCDEGTVTLTANTDIVPANVDWFILPVDTLIGNGITTTFTPPLGVSLVYAVSTSEAGCTERDTITVNNFPINASINDTLIICDPLTTFDLSVTNNDPDQDLTVIWNLDPIVTGPDVTVDLVEGQNSFSATVSNQFGCSETLNTMVTVIDLLGNMDIIATPDSILLNESSTITVTGCVGCTYEWDPPAEDSPVIVVTPTEDGDNVYTVTASLLGCENTLEVTVFALDALCDIDHVFFPNAFTPNNDGENDVIRLRSNFAEELLEYELLIYDRWGEEIFHSFDVSEYWDGTFRNEALAPDVYGYYLRVLCPMGEELIQKGNITLLR